MLGGLGNVDHFHDRRLRGLLAAPLRPGARRVAHLVVVDRAAGAARSSRRRPLRRRPGGASSATTCSTASRSGCASTGRRSPRLRALGTGLLVRRRRDLEAQLDDVAPASAICPCLTGERFIRVAPAVRSGQEQGCGMQTTRGRGRPVRLAVAIGLAYAALSLVVLASAHAQAFEPNDSVDQASGPLVGGQDYVAEINTINDPDYFYFNTSGQRQLDISVVSLNGSGCSDPQLLTTEGSYLAGWTGRTRPRGSSTPRRRRAIRAQGHGQYELPLPTPDRPAERAHDGGSRGVGVLRRSHRGGRHADADRRRADARYGPGRDRQAVRPRRARGGLADRGPGGELGGSVQLGLPGPQHHGPAHDDVPLRAPERRQQQQPAGWDGPAGRDLG